MIIQFAGPADKPPIIPTAINLSDPTTAFVLGIAALFLFSKLKHGVKEKRISIARSRLKRQQSRLRSLEGKLTKRGSRRAL